MVRVSQVPMMETLTVAAAQMTKARVASSKSDSGDNEGQGSNSETEGSDAGRSSCPSKSDHAKSPPKASSPVKKVQTPPRCSHYLTWTARILRRSRGPSGTGMPASWTQTLASGETKRSVRATCNGSSMTKRLMITQTPARWQNIPTC